MEDGISGPLADSPAALDVAVPAVWMAHVATDPWCPPSLADALSVDWCTQCAVEPRVVAHHSSAWNVLGASVRGRSHAHRSEHRDDAVACGEQDGVLVLAVADGAGSSALSRVGAAVTAQMCLDRTLARVRAAATATDPVTALGTAMAHAVHDAATRLHELAALAEVLPSAFRTTLIVVAIHGDVILVSRIGDGAVLVEKRDGSISVIGDDRVSAWAGEVQCFVPDPCAVSAAAELRQLQASEVRLIALMTDGIDDPFHPLTQSGAALVDQWRSGTRASIGSAQQPAAPAILNDSAALLTWLGFEQRGESDDRTLLVAVRTDE
jgi:hypothetical protein